MQPSLKQRNIFIIVCGFLILGYGIWNINNSSPLTEENRLDPDNSVTYTNEKLGFSVDMPNEVTLKNCTLTTEDGKTHVDVSSFKPMKVPLRVTETTDSVIFHPEFYFEAVGEIMVNGLRYNSDCKKNIVDGASLTQRGEYRDFPYWTIVSDTAPAEKDISPSVLYHCTNEAKFMGLKPASDPEVLEVEIDVDMTKAWDSSAIFCPDLIFARYVPATQRLYYLFNNGHYVIDDPTHKQIQKTLRFITTQ